MIPDYKICHERPAAGRTSGRNAVSVAAGGDEAFGPVRNRGGKKMRVGGKSPPNKQAVASLQFLAPYGLFRGYVCRERCGQPPCAMSRTGHAHTGGETQGRLKLAERNTAGIMKLMTAQDAAPGMKGIFPLHRRFHIPESLRARIKLRTGGKPDWPWGSPARRYVFPGTGS